MSNSKTNLPISELLTNLINSLAKAKSKNERDKIWDSVKTPLIEDIKNDNEHQLVTFLYRLESHASKARIYLWSAITDTGISDKYQLINIPDTDILYLSVILPNTLRTTYNFLKIDESIEIPIEDSVDTSAINYPMPAGEFERTQTLLMNLFEQNKVELDQKNSNKIIYYMDYDNPDKYFGMESILELPQAPKQENMPSSLTAVREDREQMKKGGRFIENTIQFSETSLKNLAEYKDQFRKYWIYLPEGYQPEEKYPLLLFLDGSDFLNPIPTPSILDKMIKEKIIQPVVAIFLDYSPDNRQQEYYCDDHFTRFIVNDFLQFLQKKHHLLLINDANLNIIIGLSASGLAAFYTTLSYPNVFGNVITYSASFESVKETDLEEMLDQNYSKNKETIFMLVAGAYEKTPIELQFYDQSKQSQSIYQANKNMFELMNKKGLKVNFHEFVGGHNYICWRNDLPDRLKDLMSYRMQNIKRHIIK